MYILNARVVLTETKFIVPRLFGYNWKVKLCFAVEIERSDYRSSMDCTRGLKYFKTLQSALIYAEELKSNVDGPVREQYYLTSD